MKNILFVLILFSISLSCSTENKEKNITGKKQYKDYLNCFHEDLTEYDNSPVSLELSGVSYYHDSIFIVSEQKIPGTSSFYVSSFKIPFKKRFFSPIVDPNILKSLSFGGLALTPHQKYLFAVTSFELVDKDFSGWDNYNMLFYKRLAPPSKFKLANQYERDNIRSSVGLHKKIRKSLRTKLFKEGPPYFKIGGIAAIKQNILLFAISEIGKSKSNNEKVNIIVGAKYQIINNEFSFTEELKEYYRFSPEVNYNLSGNLSITGIEYDIYNDRLDIITAYKNSDRDIDIGGYLWTLPMRDFILKKEPKLVKDDDGLPISFSHKPGGITILDKDQILIVFDDDRIAGSDFVIDGRKQFQRKLSQAAYIIMILTEN